MGSTAAAASFPSSLVLRLRREPPGPRARPSVRPPVRPRHRPLRVRRRRRRRRGREEPAAAAAAGGEPGSPRGAGGGAAEEHAGAALLPPPPPLPRRPLPLPLLPGARGSAREGAAGRRLRRRRRPFVAAHPAPRPLRSAGGSTPACP